MNLATNLVDAARTYPDRTAYSCRGIDTSYSEFLRKARDIAGAIRSHGVAPGSTVALSSTNVPAFPVVFYGALLAGCAVVPLNPQSTAREVIYFLEDSHADVMFALPSIADTASRATVPLGVPLFLVSEEGACLHTPSGPEFVDPVHRDDSDTAVVLYTSGTTGRPKGAMLTHSNLDTNARTTRDTMIEAEHDDVVMSCLPLFHVFGLTCNLNASVTAGAELVLVPRFEVATVLSLIEDKRVTIFAGVPTMYAAMLNSTGNYDLSSLRVCLSGGAPLPVEILHGFEGRYGCSIYEGYGLSETSPAAVFNRPSIVRKPGSIGLPVRGVEVRVIDPSGGDVEPGAVGEIVIRGECVMAGYLGRPDATKEAMPDGWFRSGDLGRTDEDGYLYIVDRKKQMIIRGGYNVYPREVEEVLYEHPAIREAAVIGIKHPTLGEEIGAAVVVRDGYEFNPDEIRAFCMDRIARFQYPRRIWSVPELPKSTVGKILHREIAPPTELKVE